MKNFLYSSILVFILLSIDAKAQFTASTFAAKIDFTTGSGTSNPQGVISTDLDGDGKPDIVIGNSSNTSISVFRNTSTPGNISLATQQIFSVVSTSSWVNFVDLDGDGKKDVMVGTNSGSQFSIFRNTSTVGTISFATRIDITANSSPSFIAVGDLDADGKPDLAVPNYSSGNVSVFRNTSTSGTISFATKTDITVGSGPTSAVIYDIDGDAKNDILITNYNSYTISVLKNSTTTAGSISVSLYTTLTTPYLPNSMKAGDFDNDGRIDIVCSNYNSNNISVFRNASVTPGLIVFNTRVDFASGSSTSAPQGSSIVDLDNDQKLDFAVVNRANNSVSVFKNISSSGTFTTSSFATKYDYTLGSSCTDLYATDMDGDMKPDLIATNNGTNTFSILRNTILFPEPTISASNFTFSNIQNSNMTVSFTKGNGTSRIILVKQGSAISSAPFDSTIYSANSVFGSGSQIGTGNYVVYSDTGNTFTLSGLSSNTTYYFAVFEYNGVSGYANYLTTAFSYLTGSQATLNIIYYYSKSTGYLNSLSTWGVNTDGTGTNPSSFSTANSYYFAINNSSPSINSNLTITGGNTALVVGDGVNTYNLSVPSGLSLTTDTFLLKKNSTVTINGSLIGSGNVFEDTSTAQFLSTAAQNIPTASYYNLIVGSSLKTLNTGNIIVRNSLTMISSVNLNNNIMMLGNSASQLGTLNVVTGTLFGGTFMRWFNTVTNSGSSGLFPIGTATSYRPVQINYTTAPTTAGTLAATFVNAIPSNNGLPIYDVTVSPVVQINKVGRNGTWQLTPGTLAGGQFTGSFTAAGFWGVSNDSVLRLVRRANSSGAWSTNGNSNATTGTNVTPVLSRTGMSLFGEFGVGGDSGTNALPVKLIILTVHQESEDAILNWQTASELNSDYFEIQRVSDLVNNNAGNIEWETIGKINASGNSIDRRNYYYPDNIKRFLDLNTKTIYYRLNQFDKDGFVTNSDIITLNLKTKLSTITLYPLPINNILTAVSNNSETINELSIFDMSGKQIIASYNSQMDVSSIAQGMYIVKVITNKQTYFQKITK
jgi:FG-GAP-like repeat/Secretion system C-terminal sorting domain/FG-GAP repeat